MGSLKWLWAFVDLLLALVGILGVVVFALAVSVNPKTKASEETVPPPGDMMVCAFWTGNHDVDLWGDAPGQKIATGYSAKNGKVLDLVRDDLGTDNTPNRTECQFARGLPDGRYVFNIHGYSIVDKSVNVRIEIRAGEGLPLLLGTDMELRQKQERTVAQFRMAGGSVVPGSVNQVFVALRSAKK